jgi:hypothetical protein
MTKVTIDKNSLIDCRNKFLVNDIYNNGFDFIIYRFEPGGLDYWVLNNKDKDSKLFEISAGVDKFDKDYFTHELLHISEEIHGQESNGSLIDLFKNKPAFCEYIKISYINNAIQHCRFLPKYLELGFENDKFLYKYNGRPDFMINNQIKFDFIKDNDIEIICFGDFITNFFNCYLHPNKTIKEDYKLNYLKEYIIYNKGLVYDLIKLADDWTENIIIKNSDFICKLLVILVNWKNNNYR